MLNDDLLLEINNKVTEMSADIGLTRSAIGKLSKDVKEHTVSSNKRLKTLEDSHIETITTIKILKKVAAILVTGVLALGGFLGFGSS